MPGAAQTEMNKVKEIREKIDRLRQRKAQLEQQIADSPGRALKIELASVQNELSHCALELKEHVRNHHVSYRRASWEALEGISEWNGFEDKTWEEVERLTETKSVRDLTDPQMMRIALEEAKRSAPMTEKQREYFTVSVIGGKKQAQVAREMGLNKSTISRTVSRGRRKLEQYTKAAYEILKHQEDGDVTVIDLGLPEVMEAVLGILTPNQQILLYLYYGEWMSLREIQIMFRLHTHTSVMRSIRLALERISSISLCDSVELRGWDRLEEMLIYHYNHLDMQEVEESIARNKYYAKKNASKLTNFFFVNFRNGLIQLTVPKKFQIARSGEYRDGSLQEGFFHTQGPKWGSGKLISMLREYIERAGGPKVDEKLSYPDKIKNLGDRIKTRCRAIINKLFELVRRSIHADHH